MSSSIRLTREEKTLAESYAKLHSISVGEAFKRALFEKIEDEYDPPRGRGGIRRISQKRKEKPTDNGAMERA